MGILRGTLFVSLVLAAVQSQYVLPDENSSSENWPNRNTLAKELNEKLQAQVSMEMKASLVYMVMASHFGSEEVNRPGFTKFFKQASDEERDHAQKLIEYLSKRGTKLQSLNIEMPTKYSWNSGMDAFDDAITLENLVTDSLMDIHKLATDKNDAHLTHFLESEYLEEQIESIRKLSGLNNNLNAMAHKNEKDKTKHAQNKLAEYLFDLELQKSQ